MTFIRDKGKEDAFGNLIADNTSNKADIASHYKFSPERWRLFKENTGTGEMERQFVQYGDTTGFSDNVGSYTVVPPSGGVGTIRTAERFRYVVGYVSEISFSFQANQSLQAGDKVVVGYGNPDLENGMASADGYMIEFEPGLADNEAYFSIYRNGTVVSNGGSRKLVTLEKPITTWRRFAIDFNWYNVGNVVLAETYTDGGEQLNPVRSKVSVDDGKGSENGNKRLHFSIQDGGNGLELETGSASVITKGNVQEIRRFKGFWQFGETIGTADSWVPLLAFRRSPGDRNVNLQVNSLQVLDYSETDNVVLICKCFDSSNVTFGGTDSWGPAEHITGQNSAVETREDVDQFADDTGTLVSNTATPGGYKVARSVRTAAGGGNNTRTATSPDIDLKRSVFNGDVAVILGLSGTTGDVGYEFSVSEDW